MSNIVNSRAIGWPQENLRRAIEAYKLDPKADSHVVVANIARALLRHQRDLEQLAHAQGVQQAARGA